MSAVKVDPDELEQLAKYQDQAAEHAGAGAAATQGFGSRLWDTHGPACKPSTDALNAREREREVAGRTIQQACQVLAAMLRSSADAYTCTDEEAAAGLH